MLYSNVYHGCFAANDPSRSLLILFLIKSSLAITAVALSQPRACLIQLLKVDPLLDEHDWSTCDCEEPRPEGVHLVSSCHLHRCCGKWRWEKQTWLSWSGSIVDQSVDRKQRRCYRRAAEAEQIQCYEEELVHCAACEEHSLCAVSIETYIETGPRTLLV